MIINLPLPGLAFVPQRKFILLPEKLNSNGFPSFANCGPLEETLRKNLYKLSSFSNSSLLFGINFWASCLSSEFIEAKIQDIEFLIIGGTEWYLWDMRIRNILGRTPSPNTFSNWCLISPIKFFQVAAFLAEIIPDE